MANHLYGYTPSSYGGAAVGAAAATSSLSSVYIPRSLSESYLSDPITLRYIGSDPLDSSSKYSLSDHHLRTSSSSTASMYEVLRYSSTPSAASHLVSQGSWSSADIGSAADPLLSGIKRSSDALYHQTVLDAHNAIGQTEAWYSTNSLAKRPRFDSASNLPIYPQRPGEKDCAHYMLTRTCKFGDSCKFDHPIWVPEGGIPDWKEVPPLAASESLPERPGEPDCPYFLKTQRCKFGLRCKFNHPKDNVVTVGASDNAGISALPERPSEPLCAFYMKTGKCKFGATCKFHHPKDIQIPLIGQQIGNSEQTEMTIKMEGATGDAKLANLLASYTPASLYNSKGLPVRLSEADCPFYLKTGSCKYGATCRYNHPDRNAINPPAAVGGHPIVASPGTNLNIGVVNPATSIYQAIDPRLGQPTVAVSPTIYPQRPGQIECDYYMKTGECKFGENCKFHHPIDRSAPSLSKAAQQQTVKLTLAGLPRREDAIICPYYLKTATCKFGATCKFDHPPPGEVMAMAASQGGSNEAKVDGKEAESGQE
ncbi:Zinc finger CCCH domain-containing protein 37 [Morella rubra]|uniref:Zinc finger CCCH domain-containing protein 37 n=1 Tax=Morella rubra TaxID=262757 RepID=A0A6A1VPU5_9ROSI|nr:Zinc finger CCCH domain-containing protein 37 [Morella rubra]